MVEALRGRCRMAGMKQPILCTHVLCMLHAKHGKKLMYKLQKDSFYLYGL